MKYIILLFLLISLALIISGIYFDVQNEEILKNKCYGFGIAGLMFVTMPLFLLYRSTKSKMLKDLQK